jgi:hypothetical protein
VDGERVPVPEGSAGGSGRRQTRPKRAPGPTLIERSGFWHVHGTVREGRSSGGIRKSTGLPATEENRAAAEKILDRFVPEPKRSFTKQVLKKLVSVQLLQKTLETNTQSMEQLRAILFKDISTIRISDTFEQPEMATDLFESDLDKLNILRQRGSDSFASRETQLKEFLLQPSIGHENGYS